MRPAPLRPAATVSTAAAQPQRYLTNDEAAEYLRLSPRTLEKQRVIGGGPRFRKFGARVVYAVADLRAWAYRNTFGMTSGFNHKKRKEVTEQGKTYTCPQPTLAASASTPGSRFKPRGGSVLLRRGHSAPPNTG